MKSYFYNLIPFLPVFCKCQFRRLDSIQFLCSQAHNLAGWRLETRLQFFSTELFITTLHGPRRKQSLYFWQGMFTAPLHCNGSYSIFACVCRYRAKVFTESLPRNERLFWLQYSGFRVSCHTVFATNTIWPKPDFKLLKNTWLTSQCMLICNVSLFLFRQHLSIYFLNGKGSEGTFLFFRHRSREANSCMNDGPDLMWDVSFSPKSALATRNLV
jgi:hypothetical protein